MLATISAEEPVADWTYPCNPNRKLCGRINITIAAPGKAIPYYGGKKGVDDDLADANSNYAHSDFQQFRKVNVGGMQAYSIVMSSDPILAAKVDKYSDNEMFWVWFQQLRTHSENCFQMIDKYLFCKLPSKSFFNKMIVKP